MAGVGGGGGEKRKGGEGEEDLGQTAQKYHHEKVVLRLRVSAQLDKV